MAKQQQGLRIPVAKKANETETLEFSFKHLDIQSKKFDIASCTAEYFRSLLIAVQKYSGYTVDRFRDQNKQTDRHTIDFSETSEPNGFSSLDDNLNMEEPWQIRICPEEKKEPEIGWRASGILIGNIFYMVWLDPRHKLYPDHHPNHTAPKNPKKKK